MRAVRSAERISGVRDAGELLILGMETVGCGAIFEYEESSLSWIVIGGENRLFALSDA